MAFDWKSLIPVFETAGNIAELAIPGGAAFIPLTQAAEAALNPILMKIGSGQVQDAATINSEVMSFYGAAIAALTLAKQKGGLDQATLDKINGYLQAAQDAAAAWLDASKGFDPSQFQPVTPIP